MIKENQLRVNNDKYNEATRARHLANEICWSFHNHNKVLENLSNGSAMDLVDVPKKEGDSILIIGSGPSFDRVAPYLKDWKGDIMTSTSQAATCIYYGKDPKYIVALDPNSHEFELMANTFEDRDCTLIVHPGVKPNLLDFWQGKSFYYRKIQPQTAFYSNAQQLGYSTPDEGHSVLIKTSVIMLACVAAAQVCIANILGYKRMFLVGVDFGCPGGQTRFTQYDYKYKKKIFAPGNAPEMSIDGGGDWIKKDPPPITNALNVLGENGCPTHAMHTFYKQQFMTAWRILQCDFINVSSDGLLYELPQADIEDVIRRQGQNIKGFNQKQIKETADLYLANHSVYIIETYNGVSVFQFKNPLIDIPDIIDKMRKTMKPKNPDFKIDKRKNMQRFEKILRKVGTYETEKIKLQIYNEEIIKQKTLQQQIMNKNQKLQEIQAAMNKKLVEVEKDGDIKKIPVRIGDGDNRAIIENEKKISAADRKEMQALSMGAEIKE